MMGSSEIHAVTGAFGYTGKYIAYRLLQEGDHVITLTNSPERSNPFQGRIRALSFSFDQPHKLIKNLRGVSVLYNTYWIRFNHKLFRHADAIENTRVLFRSAKAAGVKRVVHVSVTNPSENSDLEYFRGKAILETALKETGISYAILRPALIFGKEDILINNIAWIIRRFSVFAVPGDGQYRLQPIYVDDLAQIAVKMGLDRENRTVDCIGPETYSYMSLVRLIAAALRRNLRFVSCPPAVASILGGLIGLIKRDVLITRQEIQGLMDEHLYVDSKPLGETQFSEWIRENSSTLGIRYSSELSRRKDRVSGY